jgi:uracil-DNA glycosylase
MPEIRRTLLVGTYAQARILGKGAMTDRVRAFRDHLPFGRIPLPHPSWRTRIWEKRNPWFTEELLPELRAQVAAVLAG